MSRLLRGLNRSLLETSRYTVAAPTNLVATPIGPDNIELTWIDPPAALPTDNEDVARSGTPGGPYSNPVGQAMVGDGSLQDFPLAPGTYYYVVRVVRDGVQISPNSNEASATVP